MLINIMYVLFGNLSAVGSFIGFLNVKSNHCVDTGISFVFCGQNKKCKNMNDKLSVEMKCL